MQSAAEVRLCALLLRAGLLPAPRWACTSRLRTHIALLSWRGAAAPARAEAPARRRGAGQQAAGGLRPRVGAAGRRAGRPGLPGAVAGRLAGAVDADQRAAAAGRRLCARPARAPPARLPAARLPVRPLLSAGPPPSLPPQSPQRPTRACAACRPAAPGPCWPAALYWAASQPAAWPRRPAQWGRCGACLRRRAMHDSVRTGGVHKLACMSRQRFLAGGAARARGGPQPPDRVRGGLRAQRRRARGD